MSNGLSVDYDAWSDHAQWWQDEGGRVRERMSVDDDTISAATHAFGKIGSATVGAAYAETLSARRAAGERLGQYAERGATHIRNNLQTYHDTDSSGARTLST